LISTFEKQTGIDVRVRTNDGVVLADQILQEGTASLADVYLTENSPELMMLQQHKLLAKLPASILDQVPRRYDSPNADWVGLALRVAALAYDPSQILGSQLPPRLLDLAQPQWKGKIAVAPSDSDFVPLVGAVIATDGTRVARSWLAGIKANAAVYQDDEAVVQAVNRGAEAVGVINQYYWYRLQLEIGASNMKSRLYFFPHQDIGSTENISGAAVLASSVHKTAALKFLAFLVSPQGQDLIASGDDFEYPARTGVNPSPKLPPLGSLEPATISVTKLGNDLSASTLIQQAGLL
jgi:iron(III) transport system substrate-binding protein